MNVRCIETGKVYCSTVHATENTNANQSSVSACCNGKKKTSGGFHWEFTTDKITETRTCVCGREYMPTPFTKTFCSKACHRKAHRYGDKRFADMDWRPFTFNTNMMIVNDYERYGNLDRLSEATMRSRESLYAQRETLISSGQYDLFKRLLHIQSTLQNHEAGVRIA